MSNATPADVAGPSSEAPAAASTSAAPPMAADGSSSSQPPSMQTNQLDPALAPSAPQQQQQSSTSMTASTSSSSTTLDSIDAVCNAIHNVQTAAGDAQMLYKLTRESLLPALSHLEARGASGATILRSALQGGQDPLQALLAQIPPTGIGLGYLSILVARCAAVQEANIAYIVPFVLQYIQAADPHQLQLVPQKAGYLASFLVTVSRSHAHDAIEPLLALLSKLQGDYRNHLTSIHPPLLYAALLSGQHAAVRSLLLHQPVTDLNTRIFPVTYQDNLKYGLYGGILFAAGGEYKHAIELFTAAVSAPSHPSALSLMQIDAYKHLILCQLLEDGTVAQLPKFTSTQLTTTFRQLYTSTYLDFAKAYAADDVDSLINTITQNRKTYETDETLGLVTRCIQAIPARRLVKLANVYQTIELREVVQSIGIIKPESDTRQDVGQVSFTDAASATGYTRQLVQLLISQGKIRAVLKSDGASEPEYLEFLATAKSTTASAAAVQQSLQLLRRTSWTVSQLDKRITTSKDFLTKANNMASRGGGLDPGGGDFGTSPGFTTGEEDLMGGSADRFGEWLE